MNIVSEVITALVTGITISGVLIYLGKIFLKKYVEDIAALQNARELAFQKEMGKIEATKNSIQELTRAVEEVKEDFDLNKITYQIQFSKVTERRIEILEKMYKKLFRLQEATEAITVFMQPIINDPEAENNSRIDEVMNAYNDFRNYFPSKMLYFNDEFNFLLSDITELYWECMWDSTGTNRISVGATKEDIKEARDKSKEARQKFKTVIPETLTKLDIECKKLIGIYLPGQANNKI
jgi:hypothetical protein